MSINTIRTKTLESYSILKGQSFSDLQFDVTASYSSFSEGDFVTFTVNTVLIPDNTILYWFLEGVSPEHVVNNQVSGLLTIVNNTASVQINTLVDAISPTNKNITFHLLRKITDATSTIISTDGDLPLYYWEGNGTVSSAPSTGVITVNSIPPSIPLYNWNGSYSVSSAPTTSVFNVDFVPLDTPLYNYLGNGIAFTRYVDTVDIV